MRSFFRILSALALLCATLYLDLAHASSLAPAASVNPAKQTILVVGDSLSAEYGIARGSGWVPLLAERIAHAYPSYRVVNASISGDTTSGGLSRLPALLDRDRPAIVVLELGANDALRGLALEMTEKNLTSMTQQAKNKGARVLIIGMRIPPNYGRAYSERFMRIFASVSKRENAVLVPFFMAGLAQDRALFQADGLHPVAAAQPALLANVWPTLESMLKK